MGSWSPTPCQPGHRVRRPARVAVALSVVVHATLALLAWPRNAAAPRPKPDAIEVDFSVADVPAEATAEAGELSVEDTGPSLVAAPKLHERRGPRSPKLGEPHSQTSSPHGAGDAHGSIVDAPQGQSPAHPVGEGASDRFTTFRPARPDLSRVPDVQGPEAKRDLLAIPRVPDKAPGELPRQLRGPGGVSARIDDDGHIHFKDPRAVGIDSVGAGSLGGPLDLSDQLMRLAGQDPYASTKRKMAEETREQRLCMARRAQHAREAQALFELSSNVRAIAERKDWAPEERRRALFDIWDECDDGDSNYAAMARATITAIIRQAFPQGSDLAYQPHELLALNGRRSSHLVFAPYVVQDSRRRLPGPEDCRAPDAGRALE